MSPDRRKRSVTAAVVFLSLCGAVLAHFTIVERFSPALGALISLVPAAGFVLWTLRRSRHRAWLVPAVAGLAAVALWSGWSALERNFTSVLFAEHASANLVLAIVFGRTLGAGQEPLCTRFARILHGALPPEVEAYTRRITIAWTIFFATLCALSVILYVGGFLAAWSLLATILSPILLALMFVVEYAVRLRALPHWERTGVLGGIRAFSRHFAAARFEAPR